MPKQRDYVEGLWAAPFSTHAPVGALLPFTRAKKYATLIMESIPHPAL